MDGTGGGAAGTAGSALRYSVLYYKRTNKVHKNRGVSRLVSLNSASVYLFRLGLAPRTHPRLIPPPKK